MKLHSALLIIFSFFLLLATTKSQDFPVGSCGDQAGGSVCAEGFCCSKWGWCGNNSAHCDPENCQSQCPTPPSPSPPPQGPFACAVQLGRPICPEGMCCSTNGLCYPDTLRPFCMAPFCLSQCRDPSPPPPPPPPPPQGPIQCGVQHGGAKCPEGMCCSTNGLCYRDTLRPFCMGDFCQSQCKYGTKCSVEGGCKSHECCTKGGYCAGWAGVTCSPQFCESQCPPIPARIAMLKAIA